ncbi:glycosyl hydrolase 108 family protein [Luteibacter sp. ME-Dv--P-043b]|jgi:lysozyme family protein|uniref:glycoside hydrolase family 108 protein n=1 Tax=Luteibacter sp. ME-Dv--P-043b TaxID=3040291 RepID=UPI0025524147|nr:glycosyl hydrolase 108 family protein [Luteibacter sp. ME-Dv--P-043b]
MADFHRFAPILFKHEGGYVNDPNDPGGATNRGITLATFAHCARELLGIAPTIDALRELTEMQAATIYKALYWDAIRGDEFASQHLANMVCDFQVNAGAASARLLQRVLNSLGAQPRLHVDGRVGKATMKALREADAHRVQALFQEGRRDYYRNLVTLRPSLARFLKGWLRRVDSFDVTSDTTRSA